MTGCARPGSLGRHVLGDPDWAGRQTCHCGRTRRLPPGTHGLPDTPDELHDRLLALLTEEITTP